MVPSVSFLTDGSVKGYEKMFVIAGLGPPGKKYEKTRHNMGFLVIDRIAEKCGIDVSRIKHRALVGDGIISGRKVLRNHLQSRVAPVLFFPIFVP